MRVGTVGHYHTPTGGDNAGYCQTALVCGVDEMFVNVHVWDHLGIDQGTHEAVQAHSPAPDHATFHELDRCPWNR